MHTTAPIRPINTVCVDLDGTLIRGDSFWQVAKFLPLHKAIFSPFKWSAIKTKLTLRGTVDASAFFYHQPLLTVLRKWKELHVPMVLATGAHKKIAHAVADHLDLFQEVIAGSENYHCVAANKARLIQSRFPNFVYIGNSWQDLAVWKHASSIGVNSQASYFLKRYLITQQKKTAKPIFFV